LFAIVQRRNQVFADLGTVISNPLLSRSSTGLAGTKAKVVTLRRIVTMMIHIARRRDAARGGTWMMMTMTKQKGGELGQCTEC
jgi:hypothetical protein